MPFAELRLGRGVRQRRPKTRQPRKARKWIESRLVGALNDPRGVLFLDVETTGLSRYYDDLTLVGWLANGVYDVYVTGDDPEPLLSALRAASVLVTFNGTLFDLGFLRKSFSGLALPEIHADLRYLARRAGLTGGQKAIEKELGIEIRKGVEDLDGAQAVLLWHRYLRGDNECLRRLIAYNQCDVLAMRYILDEVLARLVVDPDLWFESSRFSQQHYSVAGWAVPERALPVASRLQRAQHTFESLFGGSVAESATIVGIDLTGSETRPSGWCVLRGMVAETEMVKSDDEIVERVTSISPALVSIDSPLSIPFGRTRVDDDDPSRAEFGIMRRCERELKRRGINVYPCLLPSMQALTSRGMRLAARLRRLGVPVIESYPGAAQDIMGIPRKGAGEAFLKAGLEDFGILGSYLTEPVRHDELDAITSALVGSFLLAGKFEALSGPSEDPLVIPDVKAAPGPVVVGISGRICAGKTTAAEFLKRKGFAYTRFSLVVDDEIRRLGQVPNRETRQKVGLEINRTKGQRWLCEQVLARVAGQPLVVVDGLRFLEDRASFVEQFGARFMHMHVVAPLGLRKQRYRNADGPSLEKADAEAVEAEINDLGAKADITVDNLSTIVNLERTVEASVRGFMRKVGAQCPFPSS